jgi:hypothetical protein
MMAAGVMAGAGMITTTAAEAHGCCSHVKKVRYYKPTTQLVRKVEYVRVRSYRTVHVKRLYRDRCGCRKFYRTVAYRQPTTQLVRKVRYERVRAYRTVVGYKHVRRHCCCGHHHRWWW